MNFDNLDAMKYKISVYSDGFTELAMGGAVKTRCRLKMTYFPFDNQACYIEFTLVSYNYKEVSFYYPIGVDLELYRKNLQWTVVHTREVVGLSHIYSIFLCIL